MYPEDTTISEIQRDRFIEEAVVRGGALRILDAPANDTPLLREVMSDALDRIEKIDAFLQERNIAIKI